MHFLFNGLFLLAAIKWGDWKNWKKYYSTYLFFICGDLLKNALLHDYRMWGYQETFFGQEILIGHFAIDLLIMFITYTSTIFIFLGRYPQQLLMQSLWITLWVFLYSGIEFLNLHYLNLIHHYNGWSMSWSILFNFVMFTVLRIHFKNPLAAWGVSIIWILFLFIKFNVPIDSLK